MTLVCCGIELEFPLADKNGNFHSEMTCPECGTIWVAYYVKRGN